MPGVIGWGLISIGSYRLLSATQPITADNSGAVIALPGWYQAGYVCRVMGQGTGIPGLRVVEFRAKTFKTATLDFEEPRKQIATLSVYISTYIASKSIFLVQKEGTRHV